jgi:hypothetical protein
MTPEIQDKLFKYVGALLQCAVAVACTQWLRHEPELVAFILTTTGTAYGGVAFNTPIKAIQEQRGLVRTDSPSARDEVRMRAAINRIDSMTPPPLDPPAREVTP